MKNASLFYLILLTIHFSSCRYKQTNSSLRKVSYEYETFSIPCLKDTTILTKDGIQIIINSKSIQCQLGKKINIRFAAILNQVDMIQYQRYTTDETHHPLESGGMFHLEISSGQAINTEAPIQVKIPTLYAKEDMTVYRLTEENTWIDSKIPVKNVKDSVIIHGQSLFLNLCSSCHNYNLADDMTGPALANVDLYRDMEWIKTFTRNSQALVYAGDSIASCLYRKWGSVMNAFSELTDYDIEAIYTWIAHKSRKEKLDNNNFDANCDLSYDPFTYSDTTITRITKNDVTTTHYGTVDTSLNYEPDKKGMIFEYLLEVTQSDWYNVDRFLNFPSKIDNIQLTLDSDYDLSAITICLVFKNRNIAIPMYWNYATKKFEMLYSFGKTKINFPKNEEVTIIAYQWDTKTEKITQFSIQDYKLQSEKNHIQLSLGPLENQNFWDILRKHKNQ